MRDDELNKMILQLFLNLIGYFGLKLINAAKKKTI